MTAAVWVRGVLQHDFGVPPSAIRWIVERTPAMSHGGQTGFTPPEGVTIDRAPEGASLLALLERGDLDAVMPSPYGGMTSRLNKTYVADLNRSPRARLLFDDPMAESIRAFRAHGFSHINHTVVVQNRALDAHPWIALNLFNAFAQAKQQCYGRIDYLLRSSVMAAFAVLDAQRRVFGDDPFPYGLAVNRRALEALAGFSFEQGLIEERAQIDDLFAPTTRQV
jgi:4,5-dihydroxyphthalate decarboxylase